MSTSPAKSDFTQKLLTDLRLRKQRMASGHQNSVHSSSSRIMPPADGYGITKQNLPGTSSSDRRSFSNLSSRGGNSSSSRTQQALQINPETDNNQMVVTTYGKGPGHTTERTIDLSMTLSCALDANGNLSKKITTNATAMVGFLQQISRNVTDLSGLERSTLTISGGSNSKHWPSTTQFPTLTTLHLNEISKGAQKLNRVLKAFSCVNNLNGDRYNSSVEIGRELLKGAMDLEESLRMLVSLQEASECMIMSSASASSSPHKKSSSQVKLLEMGDDDHEETKIKTKTKTETETKTKTNLEKKSDELLSVERPVFSFDRASKKHSHRRSASLGSDISTVHTPVSSISSSSPSTNQHNTPKLEGPRISNVVAKLMGLEEAAPCKQAPPPTPLVLQESRTSVDSKRFISRISSELTSSSNREQRKLESKTAEDDARDHVASKQQKVVTTEKIVILTPNRGRAEEIYGSGFYENKKLKEREADILSHYKELRESTRPHEVLQTYATAVQHSKKDGSAGGGKKAAGSSAEKSTSNNLHQKNQAAEAIQTKEDVRIISKSDQMQKPMTVPHTGSTTQNNLEPAPKRVFQGNATEKKGKKNAASSKLPLNQPGVAKNAGPDERFDRPKTPHRHEQLGGNKQKSAAEQRNQKRGGHSSKSSPVRKLRESGVAESSENPPKDIHEVVIQVKGESITNDTELRNTETAFQVPSSSGQQQGDDLMTREGKHSVISEPIKMENVTESQRHDRRPNSALQQQQEVKSKITRETKTSAEKVVGKSEITHKANERIVVKSRNTAPKNLRAVKQQQMTLTHGIKLRASEKTRSSSKGEPRVGSKRKPKTVVVETSGQQQEDNTKDIMVVNELLCSEQTDNPAWSHNADNLGSNVSPRHQKKVMGECVDKGLQLDTVPDLRCDGGKVILPTKLETLQPKPLTEEEIHLKQILITSHLFLNTAEALFKLNIPIGLLNYSSDNSHSKEENTENKLLIDCSYELLKRKGNKQEPMNFLPCSKCRVVSGPKPRCLDDLVRDICRDFETLREYGILEMQDSSQPCSEAEYLIKMVERDVGFGNADVNSMWEMGWNDRVFGQVEVDEVVIDVEKSLINRLVEEVVEGLLGVEFAGLMDQTARTETVCSIQAAAH